MSLNTAGAKWNPIDSKTDTKVPLKTTVEIALAEKKAGEEVFPNNAAAAMELLRKLNSEPVASEAEWQEKQPRLRALKKHVSGLQQGLPVVHTTGNDMAASHIMRNAGLRRTKLEMLARSHPEVKTVLQELDALQKGSLELKTITEERDVLKAACETANGEVISKTAQIVELENTIAERDVLIQGKASEFAAVSTERDALKTERDTLSSKVEELTKKISNKSK